MKGFLFVFLHLLLLSENCYSQSDLELTLQGKVLDKKTLLPVNAELDIFFDSDYILNDVQLTHDGFYKEKLKKYGWYLIDISAPGYIDVVDTLWVLENDKKKINKDYFLTPVEVGVTIVLDNVLFYFNKTIITQESYSVLDKVADFFKTNSKFIFEISGHTDDEGPDEYNLFLSQGRAQAVVDYLVGKGVDSTRLVARGYGETMPINLGKTRAAKAKNRRVEFKVIDFIK